MTRAERRLFAGATAAVLVICVLLGVFAARVRARGWPSLDADGPTPAGALALAMTAERLGWRAERTHLPLARYDTMATYLAVREDHGVREADAGRLLAAVRAGAGLVVDVRRPAEDPLSDSLGLRLLVAGTWTLDNARTARAVDVAAALDRPGCRLGATDPNSGTAFAGFALADSGPLAPGAPGRRVFVDGRADGNAGFGDPGAGARRVPAGPGPRRSEAEPRWSPIVAGFPLGRGRVVAVADASLLSNAALRTCWAAAGPAAVRALEWVAPAAMRDGTRERAAGARAAAGRWARGPLVFLQGRRGPAGATRAPSTLRAVWTVLTEVPAGRVVAQGVAAALVLLAAFGPRALPPLPERRARRRSPLEHVGALAGAYREAGATRLVARRLARGLRRRYGGSGAAGRSAGGAPSGDDADLAFLAAVAARHPAASADAGRLAAAARAPVRPAGLAEVGDAAARLDALLDAARRG